MWLHSISGSISLNDLLALDYLDREIQIVPFILDWDANLAFIELPEGTSWATLQAPIEGVFQSYFPHDIQLLALDRNWWDGSPFYAISQVESYLGLIASRYAEVVAVAQAKGIELAMESAKAATSAAATASNAAIATSQTSNPYVAIEQAKISVNAAQQAKDIALKAEQESVIAGNLAIAKANTAELEKLKAIDATTKAILATEPPRLPPRGLSTKPKEYILQEWNKERVLRAAEAESQSNIAASAAEEAKIALVLATEKKQVAIIAKEQALLATRAATEANSYVAKLSSSPIFFVGGLPLIFQSRNSDELSRNEYMNQVFPQLELSDSLAGWSSEIAHQAKMEAKSSDLFQGIEFGELSYQQRGEVALAFGFYSQAVENFAKAIATNPTHSLAYLERGIAHFGLKEYEHSLQDYQSFTSQIPNPLFISQFSLSFAKGLPKGAYEAGVGLFWFLVDFVSEPVQTSAQVFSSIFTLVNLVKNDEWGIIAEVLCPEIRQLVIQWDTLSLDQRGELAGYAMGKLGVDILLPGALTKVATKTVKGAQELAAVCKNLQIAQETLILETATGIGDVVKIAEIIETGQKTAFFAEELGFTAGEVLELKQAGKLEAAINSRLDRLVTQSESEVLKAAINKDSHVKMVRDYLDKPVKEIQKGIRSYEKQIALHQEKIANPSKFIPHWEELHPERQHALINKKWPAEIQCYTEQRDLLQSILNERVN